MKFSEAILKGLDYAQYQPRLAQRFKLETQLGNTVQYADPAGLACLGAKLLNPADARMYLPSPAWDMSIKARLWKAYPSLALPWEKKAEVHYSCWQTMLRMCQAGVPLEKIVAWIKVLGG